MKTLAISIERMLEAAARGAVLLLLIAAAAGCGGPEPESSRPSSGAAGDPCADTLQRGADCAPRNARSLPSRPTGVAPVYEVYGNSSARSVPDLEVATTAPPPNEVTKMRLEVELDLDPVAVVTEPVR